MENTQSKNKTLIWAAVGCLAVIACGVVVFLFGFGGLMWLGSQTPDNADIRINAPLNATVGDDVQIEIYVTNTGSEVLEVSSIDFSLNYLNGFNIYEVDPPYSEISQYDALGGGETFQSYYFHRSIEPGETLTLIFSAKAALPGDFSGDVDVCIDSDYSCITNIPRTVIE